MPRLKLSLHQLDNLIQRHLPSLYEIFKAKEITAELFGVQWFITLFAYDVPFYNLKLIWDLFFLKGWKFIFQFSLAILSSLPPITPSTDSETLISLIKNVLRTESVTKLVEKALKIKIANEELEKIEAIYNSHNKQRSYSKELTEETKEEISTNKDKNLNESSEASAEPIHKVYTSNDFTFKGSNYMKQNFAQLKKSQYIPPKFLITSNNTMYRKGGSGFGNEYKVKEQKYKIVKNQKNEVKKKGMSNKGHKRYNN
jgi:hypothetical protein